MRFPHDSWADVVQGKGPRNPFNGDLPFIKQEFVDSGIIEEIKEKALETSWKFLLERYQRNPRIERDSFLGFCQNVLNNFTISELEGRGIDLEQMREIANMYSHLPVAEKSLAKIERIRPSTTHKVINIVDSVVIRSRIG